MIYCPTGISILLTSGYLCEFTIESLYTYNRSVTLHMSAHIDYTFPGTQVDPQPISSNRHEIFTYFAKFSQITEILPSLIIG
jgi:hypothetical protein